VISCGTLAAQQAANVPMPPWWIAAVQVDSSLLSGT
jgi:hypothetical protein